MPYYSAEVNALENENVQGVVTDCGTITVQASSSSGAESVLRRMYGRGARIYNLRETNSEGGKTALEEGGASAIVFLTFGIGTLWALLHFLPWVGLFGGGIFTWKKTNELTEDKMSGTKRFFLLFFLTTLASTACYQGSVKVHEYFGYSPSGVQEVLVEMFSD